MDGLSSQFIPLSSIARTMPLLRKPPDVHLLMKFRTYAADYEAMLVQSVYFIFDECHTFALKHCAPACLCFLASYEIRAIPCRQRDQPHVLFISASCGAGRSHDPQDTLALVCLPVSKIKGLALMLQFSPYRVS